MLRKRTRSVQNDQYRMNQLNVPCSSSIFKRCHMFTGLSPKGLDYDSAKSPTSPLDFWVFPLKSPRSLSNESHRRNWDCSKVGLSIVDSLNDDDNKLFGKVLRSSDSKTVLFRPRIVAKNNLDRPSRAILFQGPKSLPKNYVTFPLSKTKSPIDQGNSNVIFEIGETPLESERFRNYSRSFDSYRLFAPRPGLTGNSLGSSSTTESIDSPWLAEESRDSNKCPLAKPCSSSLGVSVDNGSKMPLSASEIELSEDYTCVISHGPNPKTTHIYGDCILESRNYLSSSCENEMKEGLFHPLKNMDMATSYTLSDFLSFCHSCHEKLEEGKDIYIYRGEKAFCSLTCRSQEISMDEELEKSIEKTSVSSPKSNADRDEDLFGTSVGGFA
ncbi:Protein MARD1 [Cucurbita argyrosperma subsp. argyrosperma]|nr:Protein MARD1 [Cucurbita argyrosperma subsp. argyrosperma]